ncbi:MAG: signal recognition particle-docking protein FtsY [Burkholderiales bacterium]|nr:signal recognition particle-docking protein FtsY [Burkholderiales bacterium]
MVFNLFKSKKNFTQAPVVVDDLAAAQQESSSNIAVVESEESSSKISWSERLKQRLTKTRDGFTKKLLGVFGGGKIDEQVYEELEAILLASDIGINATHDLLEEVRKSVSLKGLKDSVELKAVLKESINNLLKPLEQPLNVDNHRPCVIMLVGVNGAGKTTSIGKLAKYFQLQGKSVILAAGDTFRAAAREQLIEWGRRNNVTVVSQSGGDSAAVCFDAIQSAITKKIDIVLADTAGRLPTQLNLMEEIKKVKRVIAKALDGAPHEILLVLDSNIGQNALNQVRVFDDALNLSGLVLTKLDGTAKGGVICAIAKERPIPLRFIGIGEAIDDLRPFKAHEYVNALFD